ncbi:hypothetical protein AMATHDRAFT_49462 [Amanita thiersii Skay4041]|uniref:Major facilitator superfamily (MFS) profile domain-containing protein n=1 Tax=Amanita thiersii Skay4041 TaxID=703135 RepID=A0A2A9ND40_9AGAR|nr:hypothetical protein AMATHDRAFT_49462 [Amanita thiersii Skay4041]
MSSKQVENEEEIGLLSSPDATAITSTRVPTPLPKLQIAILLFLQICDPIAGQSIYPYINQLIGELDITGGDPRKVGYYAGLVESLYYAMEGMTILQWGRASDRVGRKPILLLGLFGTTLSMLSFGLSRTFWALITSRALCGLLNGNLSVMKSAMGEITDPTNRAQAFAMIPVIWAISSTVGPMIGGALARPHDHFPKIFAGKFWRDYPYFLPCAAVTAIIFVAFIVTVFFFKENIGQPIPLSYQTLPRRSVEKAPDGTFAPATVSINPVPLRQLFVYPVVISVSNYGVLAFLDITMLALIPLFMAMPVDIGGLGCSPAKIGLALGIFGIGFGVFQAVLFAKIVDRFGEKRIFIASILSCPLIFASFPVMSVIAQERGVTWIVWVILGLMLILMGVMNMGYGKR